MTAIERHRALLARLGSEEGFTLAELLIAMMLGLIVLGAAVFVFTAGIHVEPRIQKRALEIQQARTMSERMTRELRQGSNASVSVDGSQLMILTYVPQSTACNTPATTGSSVARCRVFYSCTAAGSTSSCTRVECPPAMLAVGTGCSSPTTVVSGLSTNQVFTFSPQTPGQAYVGVRLQFAAENGDDAITIQDGVALRNPPLGGP
jgi:prepilin-type N-terminal cleavage/methylation domain-containing protein